MNKAQDYELNLWDDGDAGTPQSYPFVYGPGGQGEIHGAESTEPEGQAGPPSIDPNDQQFPSTDSPIETFASDQLQASQSELGVVSYAIPTLNAPLTDPAVSLSALTTAASAIATSPVSIISTNARSNSVLAENTATAVRKPTTVGISSSTLSSIAPHSSIVSATSTQKISIESLAPSTSVLLATPTPLPPTPSTAVQAFRHTAGFIVLIVLCLLVFLGTLFASISYLFRRRNRHKEDENWIGALVYDEPTTYDGGAVEHKGLGRKDSSSLEKGEEQAKQPSQATQGYGQVGISAGPNRGWTSQIPVEPDRTGATSVYPFENTPLSVYGFTGVPAGHTPGPSYHGFTPNPDYRRASALQRGPPAASDYDSYGLDGGGLTFRRDAAGIYLAPVTEHVYGHSDIATPNPFPVNSNPNPHTRRPDIADDAASHDSYDLGKTGAFAVTNLLPGDISSGSVSMSSLSGIRPRSSGRRQSGRLNDPNPSKRHEGVENRGGTPGVGTKAEVAVAPSEAGWVDSIRTTVGRMVGGSSRAPQQEEETDKFTPIPIPGLVPRRTRDTARSTIRSSSTGRQARILQRLGSTGTTSTDITTHSSDDGQIFSIHATSRRATVSTLATTRSHSQGARGKGEEGDENGGTGGAAVMESRAASAASSEWGSSDLVRVLGLSGKRRTD